MWITIDIYHRYLAEHFRIEVATISHNSIPQNTIYSYITSGICINMAFCDNFTYSRRINYHMWIMDVYWVPLGIAWKDTQYYTTFTNTYFPFDVQDEMHMRWTMTIAIKPDTPTFTRIFFGKFKTNTYWSVVMEAIIIRRLPPTIVLCIRSLIDFWTGFATLSPELIMDACSLERKFIRKTPFPFCKYKYNIEIESTEYNFVRRACQIFEFCTHTLARTIFWRI